MAPDMTEASKILSLEPHGADAFVGESPLYEWGRIYGGLVIAQSVCAAMKTVDTEGHSIHSLHAYFILGGDPNEPVRYELIVSKRQKLLHPTSCCSTKWRSDTQPLLFISTRRRRTRYLYFGDSQRFEIARGVKNRLGYRRRRRLEHDSTDPASHRVWTKYTGPIGDTTQEHLAALAYLSDTNPMDAIVTAHPAHSLVADESSELTWDDVYMAASLDHAVWFHRAVRRPVAPI